MDSVPVEGQPGQRQWPGAFPASFGLGREKRWAELGEPCIIQSCVGWGEAAQMPGGWFIPSHWPWLLPGATLPDSLCLPLDVQ